MGSAISSIMDSDRHSDGVSSLSSLSSKGTSPTVDLDTSREGTQSTAPASEPNTKPRPKYNVHAKASIPKDIAHEEYARQCIAAAESSRLNPVSLHPEEHELLRAHLSHAQVTTYLNLRNGILRLWTRNPLIGVLRDEAIGCARDTRWFDVAGVCYEWLVRRGYINYGCVENIGASGGENLSRPRKGKRKRKTVVVIGAGMSGLGCARQLEGLFSQFEDRFRERGEEPPNVVVLEGRDRIGGRVYSHGLASTPMDPSASHEMSRRTAEMGGMIITGFDRGNPLNIIVRGQLALRYHALRPTATLYDTNGSEVDQRRDELAEKLYNDILDRVSDYKFKVPQVPTIEGDKDLIEVGRDVHGGDSSKTIKAVEDSAILLPQGNLTITSQKSPTMNSHGLTSIPVSSDRLTGRPHVELGVPASHTAAFKAHALGWDLKDGVDDAEDLNLASAVQAKGATLGSVMDEAISQFRNVVHILPLDLRLMNWHIANLEYSNAINYKELSLGGWDVDAGNEWEGKHTMVVGGYQQVPRGLLNCPQPLKVQKKNAVRSIAYSPDASFPSKIECEDGNIIEADYVVSSIPLGVLKQNHVTFDPPLPEWKVGAIQRLGFGILNKVVLVYQKPFWDESRDIFGVLREPIHRASLDQRDYSLNRGRFFQWFNVTKTSGVPTLVALMAGDAAFQTEISSDYDLITEATDVLRTVFGNVVPQPTEAVVTRWGQDKFARGSYSYTGPDFRADDYEVMARPVGNLFFTGEHTCGTHPATVHGAYISGLRAASEVLEAIIGPIDVPEPLIVPKDSLKRKAFDSLRHEPKDPKKARLEAYEEEIWIAIFKKLGDRPLRPQKISANPYILFSKANFDEARKQCEKGRRPGKGKPVPNEVRNMCSKLWKQASDLEKQPFIDRAAAQKAAYAADYLDFNVKATKWDIDALAFRKEYEAAHPSVPGPDEKEEGPDTPSRRDRRAKRISGYAEDSDSDLELDSDL
jgi:monoamine oxidase